MFEHKTYENLMNEKLRNIPSSVDKREGSIVWDAMAPNSLETAMMYQELETYYKETFGSTASRTYLIERAKERGIYPKPASQGIYLGQFNIEIPIGSRFSLELFNYIVIEKFEESEEITLFEYKLQCENVGSEPNGNFGNLIPIDYIPGLTTAKLTEILIPGEDEEETERFRKRYLESFEPQAFGGNIKDYEEKTMSISGVGAVKVTPVWAGGGTVRLTILDSIYSAATSTLIETVQEIIDPTQDGSGLGLAPIDHIVTVDAPIQIPINIATVVELDNTEWNNIKGEVEKILEEYLLELRKEWATNPSVTVRIAQIESKILTVKGVVDIGSTAINGNQENFALDKYQVPVFGSIEATEGGVTL